MRTNMWQKPAAVFVVPFFIFSLIVSTAQAKPAETKPAITPDSISVPGYSGEVYKTYVAPGSDKLVIHIQDAHCNPGVQHNISRLLEDLHANNDVRIIGVEGGKGWLNTAIFNAIPGQAKREEVLRNLVDECIIDGVEEFAGNQEEIDAVLFGIESKELYFENLSLYADVSKARKGALEQIALIQDGLNSLMPHVLNDKLLKLEEQKTAYRDNSISFPEYIDYLAETASENSIPMENYPNIAIFHNSYKMEEEIDFEAVDAERTELIDSLSATLPKDKLEELVTASLKFRTGKLDAVDYYTYIYSLVQDQAKYTNLKKYIEYIKLNAKMDKKALSEERVALEKALETSLVVTPEEKKLVSLGNELYLAEKLFDIKLTRDEFKRCRDGISSEQDFLVFIKDNASRYGVDFAWDRVDSKAWEGCRSAAITFYNAALKREDTFVTSLLNKMEVSSLNIAALVTGGFHTESIEEQLQAKGISYVVIRPRVLASAPKGIYDRIMNESAKSILAHTAHPGRGTGEAPVPGAAGAVADGVAGETGADEGAVRAAGAEPVKGDTLDEAARDLGGKKKKYQAKIYAQVTPEAAKGLEAIANQLKAYIRGEKPEIIFEDRPDIGVMRTRIHEGADIHETVLSNGFINVVAANVTAKKWTMDFAKAYLATVVAQHEMDHKDRPDASEVEILVMEARNLKALGNEAIDNLIAFYRGDYIGQLGEGVTYEPDTAYVAFLEGVKGAKDESEYQGPAQTLVGAATLDLLPREIGAVTRAIEAEGAQYDYLVIDVAGLGEAWTGTVEPRRKGFKSVTAILSERVLQALRRENKENLTSVVVQGGTPADVILQSIRGETPDAYQRLITRHPAERGNRLVISRKANAETETARTYVTDAYAALVEAIPKIQGLSKPVVLQFSRDIVRTDDAGALANLRADLEAIARIEANGQQAIHVQIVDVNNQVVEIEALKGVTTTGEKLPEEVGFTLKVINRETFQDKERPEGTYFLYATDVCGPFAILAAIAATNEEFLTRQNINALPAPAVNLLRVFYNIPEGDLNAAIQEMLTNPWGDLARQILFAPMPIVNVDWNAINLMRQMLAVNA